MNKRLIHILMWNVESWKDVRNALARKAFFDHMRDKQRISESELQKEWERYLREDCEIVKGELCREE